jgi:alanyl-tRNA synthetase
VTERIYYTDPRVVSFDATVVAIDTSIDAAAGQGVVLDRTAFYPTSGGQPFDGGTLGGSRVVDVIDREDGEILHVLAAGAGRLDVGPVHGLVDWVRRFDHMQQHTGQHVFSAAFDRLLHVRTESFHLGSASSTIDLAREVSAEEIQRAESEANRIVWENRPTVIRFADASEAAGLSLRKEPARQGVLRLIAIEDFDVSACGGTHVSRTGEIGVIAVASSERFRGGTRVEFVCGGRALESYRGLRASVVGSTRLLSALPGELPAAIERVQAEAKAATRQIKDLQTRLAAHEAGAMADRSELLGGARAVLAALDGWDPAGLKAIASAIAARPGHVVVLIGTPPPSSIVIARALDLLVDCAAILKQLTLQFGGKGGGRPELAQGGGLQGLPDEILAAARAALSGAG